MVKPSWYSEERYETAQECIKAQFEKYGITSCFYRFGKNGASYTQVWDSAKATEVTPEEMLDIAVEHFNKYGEIEFEGLAEKAQNPIAVIGCWDEKAYECKCY